MTAPRIASTKHKVLWSPEGILAYQELLATSLPAIQAAEFDEFEEQSTESRRILFQMTNHILTSAAKSTNKFIDLSSQKKKRKSITVPPPIKEATKAKAAAHKVLLEVTRNLS